MNVWRRTAAEMAVAMHAEGLITQAAVQYGEGWRFGPQEWGLGWYYRHSHGRDAIKPCDDGWQLVCRGDADA